MTYFVDVFSVATYEEFSCTDKAQAGFHPKRRAWVTKIKPGDKVLFLKSEHMPDRMKTERFAVFFNCISSSVRSLGV